MHSHFSWVTYVMMLIFIVIINWSEIPKKNVMMLCSGRMMGRQREKESAFTNHTFHTRTRRRRAKSRPQPKQQILIPCLFFCISFLQMMNVYYFHHQADELLGTASEQFLGKTVKEIKQTILQTLEGHLRAILGLCLNHPVLIYL